MHVLFLVALPECPPCAPSLGLPCAIQAGLVYRAIKLNIKLFNFERALDLAVQHKQHQDTVLWYRTQFLRTAKQQETIARFMQMSESVSLKRWCYDRKVGWGVT